MLIYSVTKDLPKLVLMCLPASEAYGPWLGSLAISSDSSQLEVGKLFWPLYSNSQAQTQVVPVFIQRPLSISASHSFQSDILITEL